MQLKNEIIPSLKSVGREVGLDVSMVNGKLQIIPLTSDSHHQVDFILPSMAMVEACRANDFDFFQPAIDAGLLTVDQMHHAAERYYLGKTKNGQPIFWMLDEMFDPLDAHITDRWISSLLKRREPLLESWRPTHCLFGLHLLCHTEISENTEMKSNRKEGLIKTSLFANNAEQNISVAGSTSEVNFHDCLQQKKSLSVNSVVSVWDYKHVAIVENEQSAVILSELFPESLWMAYATPSHLCPELLAPLLGHTVTIYPRTDETMSTYLFFLDYADVVRRRYSLDLHVDDTLENHATPDQKSRCIDILDFILENDSKTSFFDQKVQSVTLWDADRTDNL